MRKTFGQVLLAVTASLGATVLGAHAVRANAEVDIPNADADDSAGPVPGTLDKDVIRQVIHYHLGEVKACYEAALSSDPEVSGYIDVQFEITPDGLVDRASATPQADPLPTDLQKCILGVVYRLQFPRPDGDGSVEVTYPFTLTTSDPDSAPASTN